MNMTFTPAMAVALIVMILSQLFAPAAGLDAPALNYDGAAELTLNGQVSNFTARAALLPTGVTLDFAGDVAGEKAGFSAKSDGTLVTVTGDLGEGAYSMNTLLGALLGGTGLSNPEKLAAYLGGDLFADLTSLLPTLLPLVMEDVVRLDASVGETLADGTVATHMTLSGEVSEVVAALRANLISMTANPTLMRGVRSLRLWGALGMPEARAEQYACEALCSLSDALALRDVRVPFTVRASLSNEGTLTAVSLESLSLNDGVTVDAKIAWSRADGLTLDGLITGKYLGVDDAPDISVQGGARREGNSLPFRLTFGPAVGRALIAESMTLTGALSLTDGGAFDRLNARVSFAGMRNAPPTLSLLVTPAQLTFSYVAGAGSYGSEPESVTGTLQFNEAPWTTASNAYEGRLNVFSNGHRRVTAYSILGTYSLDDSGKFVHIASLKSSMNGQSMGGAAFSQTLVREADAATGGMRLTHNVGFDPSGIGATKFAWHSVHTLSPAALPTKVQ